jgi:hypothetical protein
MGLMSGQHRAICHNFVDISEKKENPRCAAAPITV